MQNASERTKFTVSVRKILMFLALYVIVVSVPYTLTTIGMAFLKQHFGQNWWIVPIAIFGILATLTPLIYIAVVQDMEERTHEDQRRYHKTLVSASAGMTRIKDVHALCRMIAVVVTRTVKLTHAGVFLFNEETQKFELAAARHKHLFPENLDIQVPEAVIHLLEKDRYLLGSADLRYRLRQTKRDADYDKVEQAYSWMRELEFRLIVPSFSGERLIGFLVLGKKRNNRRYTMDDIAIFSALTNQATLAIQNALFYDELRKNEAYMIQSEKLASLGQLASGMAHEIHNPLTIISGESQLYLERFRGKDEKVDSVLASIVDECRRAADITRRILRFAKPSRNDHAPVDIKVTVQDSLNLVGYQVRLDGVERVLNLPDDLPMVQGNQNQLQEVVLNLIVNACHAMGAEGGTLDLSAYTQNGHVVLKVSDTGPGIEEEKLKKVFDPFFTTKQSGTGLGLFVSQRIIQSHGGEMHVASEVGKGTCFTIKLPACEEPTSG